MKTEKLLSMGGEALPETKRKRRTAIQMFADHKQEHVDRVTACEEAVTKAEKDLEKALAVQAEFLAEARAALGV